MLDPRFRHYCLNSRCRAKLAAPVEINRKAFCSTRCHAGFYRSHCLVCDRGLPPGSNLALRRQRSNRLVGNPLDVLIAPINAIQSASSASQSGHCVRR